MLAAGQDSQRLDAGTFYHPLEENLCPSPARTARGRTRKFLKLDRNYPVLYRVLHELGVRLQFVSATSRPLLPRGYHFFAAATETLVGEPALAAFFSA